MLVYIINHLNDENYSEELNIKEILTLIMKFIGILISALLLYYITQKFLELFVPSRGYIEGFAKNMSISERLSNSIKLAIEMFNGKKIYGGELLRYTPVILIIIQISILFKYDYKKSWISIIPIVGLVSCPFILFLLGSELPLRTFQSITLFIALAGWILCTVFNSKIIHKLCIIALIVIVSYHAQALNQLTYGEYVRYQEDIAFGHQLANSVIGSNEGILPEKPVVVIGYRFPQSKMVISNELIGYSMFQLAGGHPVRVAYFLNLIGYRVAIPTNEMIIDSKKYVYDMPIYPKQGSIVEHEEYFLVKISEPVEWSWGIWE